MPREREAYDLVVDVDCSGFAYGLLPGLHQLCLGKTAEGATLLGLGVAQLGVGTAVAIDKDVMHPGAAIPLVGAGDLLLYSAADYAFEEQRARRFLYVPQNRFDELLTAPFNPEVLTSVDVFTTIIVAIALEMGLDALTGDSVFKDTRLGANPNLFGATVDKRIGDPTATLIGAGTFLQVAVAEESFFRGVLQSGIARNYGENAGWLWGTLLFGLAHAPNALFIDASKRLQYLEVAVPFITALGGSLGLSYRIHDYSLLAPVAIHFWYDFLISAIAFYLHPDSSPLAARIVLPF
jgi:membrane protease YdiL (CAAX protease family)